MLGRNLVMSIFSSLGARRGWMSSMEREETMRYGATSAKVMALVSGGVEEVRRDVAVDAREESQLHLPPRSVHSAEASSVGQSRTLYCRL